MSRNATMSGAQVGQMLNVKIEFTGDDCVHGDAWRLSATGLTLMPAIAQEIPAGAASHTLTWKSAAPLATTLLASSIALELRKERGAGASPTPIRTFWVAIQPAASVVPATPALAATKPPANPAPAAPAATPATIPQPLQVQVVGGSSSAARWINGAGIMGWLGGLVILLVALAFLYVVLYVIAPAAVNGLSNATTAPAGQSMVVTTVEQTTVSDDPAVLKEAAKASANISH